ncbi:MAG TPA: hydrolase 2, exosortase A system-associated, partial [Roseateles sp.]|nr:hydrolase 2, exosortase A system-associated [Roseateles sp.]
MNTSPDVFFLPTAAGEQRLCLFHAPVSAPRSKVLYLHPFAEEMNKSRRMAALACRKLAQAGHAVLQIDLRGCGDSSADFGDASWADWQADVR